MEETAPAKMREPAAEAAAGERARRRACALGAFFLLALGAAARGYGAWAARRIVDADGGVVALMVKHMVEGRGWPMFFYGQAYMGSLEPAVSAALARLFGLTGFVVVLGTALCGWLLLPLLLKWGREAGGRFGALAAAAICAIGPRQFAGFQATPRGGYTLSVLLAFAALWVGARLSVRLRRGERTSPLPALAAGLLAGLAWWSNPVISATLPALALVLAIGLRGRVWRPPALWCAAGFFLGTAPFWIWNAQNQWRSMTMFEEVGALSLREGAAYLPKRWEQMVRMAGAPSALNRAVALLYPLIGAAGAIGAVVEWRRRRTWTPTLAAAAAALGTLLFTNYLYLRSEFVQISTARYLIPQIPAFALLAAVAAGTLGRRRIAAAGLAAVLAALVVSHAPYFVEMRWRAQLTREHQRWDRELAAALEGRNVEAVYANFKHYGLNFALGERWPFTEPTNERYPEYRLRAERADRLAVLENLYGVSEFVALAGGRADTEIVGGYRLTAGFEPPSNALAEVPPADWSAARDAEGNDLLRLIADRDMDTAWLYAPARRPRDGIEIRFAAPRDIRRLRIVADRGRFRAVRARVETLDADAGEWRVVHADHAPPALHWSGPRVYYGGRRARLEYALPGGRIAGVRWTLSPAAEDEDIAARRIAEAQVFEAGEPDDPSELEAADALAERLRSADVRRVYSDRWLANALSRRLPGVETELEPVLRRNERDPAERGRIEWRRGAALVVLRADAPQTRAALAALAPPPIEIESAPWVVFLAPEQASESAGTPPVFWTGYTVFRGQAEVIARERLRGAAERFARDGDAAAAAATLRDIHRACPAALADADDLLARLRAAAPEVLPAEVWEEWRRYRPEIRLNVAYRDGLRLVGITISPREFRAGGCFSIRYFWECPPNVNRRRRAAFVHFQAGARRFQDDHAPLQLVEDRELAEQEPPWRVFIEERTVRVPADAPAGPLRLSVGVTDAQTRARLPPRTELPVRRRAVQVEAVAAIAAE